MPAGCKRSCFRLAISHHAGDDQIRMIERGSISVGQAISQLAAFVDGTGCFWRAMTRNTPWEGELLEQLLHSLSILCDVGIAFGIRTLQIRIGDDAWRPMAR